MLLISLNALRVFLMRFETGFSSTLQELAQFVDASVGVSLT